MSSGVSSDGGSGGADAREFDAIVVGTGPGGATVARELCRLGKRVLILEWGGKPVVTGSFWQALRELGMPGRSLFLTGKAIAVVRGITTGGSSIYFYGTAFDPPLEMLRRHGLDIVEEVEEAKRELGIAALPPELIGSRGTRIMESARELGYAWNPLPKFLDRKQLGGGRVMGFYAAPSYEAKWNARMFVDEATAGGAALVNEAKVRRVLVEDGAATGVEFTRKGKTERAFAHHVVVAAGGIGSPLILRASGLERAGYDFFYDPLICALGSVSELKGEQELPMQAGVLMEDEGYMLTDMTVPGSLYAAMTAQVGRLDRLFAHGRTLQIMIKVRDDLSGRLTRRGGIRKPLTREDRDRLDSGYRQAREILSNAGAKRIFRNWYMAAHPGGTVKVGDLLDAELQTEYDNLYVCDASVIPEPWGRPPTLTLIGLGKRLARHLAGPEPPARAGTEQKAALEASAGVGAGDAGRPDALSAQAGPPV
jgi:choline dehydrogenase-like flavoprotein